MRHENHNLHGTGAVPCEVYDMPPHENGYWDAVTDVWCPVEGCNGIVLWYEAGYVPGYRVCAVGHRPNELDSIRHRFLAGGNAENPTLIRDQEAEEAANNLK